MLERRVDIIAVCEKCELQFEITKAVSKEDAISKAEAYHSETSEDCDGEIKTIVTLDTDWLMGLPKAPETEISKAVRDALRLEWEKRNRVH